MQIKRIVTDTLYWDRCFLQGISAALWKRKMENTGHDQPF